MKNISYILGTKAWARVDPCPLFRHTHNAFIYLAYALLVGSLTDHQKLEIASVLSQHETDTSIKRVGTEIEPSHDEVLGFMLISWIIGTKHVEELFLKLLKEGFRVGTTSRKDYYFMGIERFLWFRAFAHAVVNYKPSLIDECLYAVWMIAGALSKDKGTTPYLKRWCTIPVMHKYAIASLGIAAFRFAMKRRGKILAVDIAIDTGVPEMADFSMGQTY